MYHAFYRLHTDPFCLAPDRLEPLRLDETRAYIEHRLHRAGWRGPPAFDERSYRMIHRFTEGDPRQINKLCSRLLLYGSTEKRSRLDCFDCLKVLKRWLEHLPGATSESTVRACVDMLNAAWNEPECGVAIRAAGTTELSRSRQHEPPPGDGQTAAEPDVESALPAAESYVLAHVQREAESQGATPVVTPQAAPALEAVAPVPAADQADASTGDAHTVFVQPSPARDTPADAAVDPRPVVPDTIVPLATAPRPAAEPKTRVAPLLARNVGRAIASLGLLAVLLSGLFLILGGEHDDEAAKPVAAQAPPARAGETAVVAKPAPRLLSLPSDGGTAAKPVDPDASPDGRGQASPPGQSQTAPAQNALASAEPARESPAAALDDHDQEHSARAEDQHAVTDSDPASALESAALPGQPPADGVTADRGPDQGTLMVSAETRVEPEHSAAQTAHSADSGMPDATDAATLSTPPQARIGDQNEAEESVAEPEAQRPSAAERQHINGLMIRAERALWEYRLTVPRADSAYHYYRQVLKVAPQHRGARAGLQRIVSRYTSLIKQALAADEIDKASKYIARGLMVNPGNRELLALRQAVETRESRLEAQAVGKAEALRAQPPAAQKRPAQAPFD